MKTTLGAVAVCALAALSTAGVAVAEPGVEDAVGRRYADAKAAFSEANLTPVVATVFGDKLPQDQCWVVSASQVSLLDGNGLPQGGRVQVNLNCYAKPATALNPGFSAADNSHDAVAVRDTSAKEELQWKQTDQGQRWCAVALEKHPEWAPIEGC